MDKILLNNHQVTVMNLMQEGQTLLSNMGLTDLAGAVESQARDSASRWCRQELERARAIQRMWIAARKEEAFFAGLKNKPCKWIWRRKIRVYSQSSQTGQR